MCDVTVIINLCGTLASVIAAGVSIYKEYTIRKQLHQNKFNTELYEIIKDLDSYVELCRNYWIVAGVTPEERNVRASEITYKGKNISNSLTIINKKCKALLTKDIVEYINDFNAIQTEATGGPFQSKMFRIDIERVKKIQDLVSSFRENIKNEIR